MGSTVTAEHTSGGVAFKHTDPVTGSVMQTNPAGEIEPYDVGRVELRALGDVLATQPLEVHERPKCVHVYLQLYSPHPGAAVLILLTPISRLA